MRRTKATDGPDGLLLIDKPAGWTSHDVVAKVRRLLGQRRAGHTGTLDPFATGLLVVCLGQATRLAEYLTAHEKEYVGEAVLGVETETDDSDGKVTRVRPVPELVEAAIQAAAARLTGTILQTPPAFSALKVDGKRAYALAREGRAPELAPRQVEVRLFEVRLIGTDRVRLRVVCGPGTYIRSLARDLGRELGCGAHLASLRRVRSGELHVREAVTMAELEALTAAGRAEEVILPADEGLLRWDAAILGAVGARDFAHGNLHRAAPSRAGGPLRVYAADGRFLGVGEARPGAGVQPLKVLAGVSAEKKS